MKRLQKVFLLVLVFVVLGCLVIAESIEVWLTGHNNEELRIIRDITEAGFTARTGIEVDYTLLSWGDNENRYLMAAASGEAPDVGGAGALFLPELGLRGALVDLSTMPGFEEVKNRATPSFYRALQYKSLTFGIPYFSTVTVGYQRDDILQSLGFSELTTWDELRQALPKIQANGSNFALQWFLTETLYADVNMFMWQRGADDYNRDLTRSGYDDPECVIAFTDYVELYTKYKIPQELPLQQAFVSGELALALSYPYFFMNLTYGAPQVAGKWSIVQAPGYIMNGKLNRTTTGTGSALGIFDSSKKKQQAWEYIKWLTEEQTQLELASRIMSQIQGAIFVPANVGSATKIGIDQASGEIFNKALAESTTSVYGLVAPRHRRRYLQMAAQRAILQGDDPKEAILLAAEEHNSEISRKQIEYDRFIKKLLGKK